jgi:phosphoribosylformylglycinamidine synthase
LPERAIVERIRVAGADDAGLAAQARHFGLALKTDELRRIAAGLGRDPTVVEAHVFDAAWSEHCSYKSSRHFLKRLPTTGPTVMQGPQEDAGIVHLGAWRGERYGIVFAHESHNHPSQVVPFEGAATGIGGIVRDVLCMGAEVIAVADPLRFGPLDDPHCRYVAQGVVDGISAYGNAIGVPNIGGDVYFHEGFRDNCLVNVVALGLVKERDIIHSAAPPGSAGWDIVLVGKATDRSGFGGAAFSSLVLDDEDAEANKGAVQVPDPFLKNVIMRASYRVFEEIRARNLTVGFKDLGAGGIAGCSSEIVGSGGFGAIVDLDLCPTSQPNLPPAVIAVGETQERLTWVVPPEFTPVLLAIYNDEFSLPLIARGARAAVIGTVTAERDYVLHHGGAEVLRVPIDFLLAGIRYDRPYESAAPRPAAPPDESAERLAQLEAVPYPETLERVLAHLDVCSRAPIYERYDGVVRGVTAQSPGYADAGVIVPVDGAPLGAALSVDGNPRFAKIDAGLAAEHAVYEAIRNVACVGARPAGLTDCLNFGNPEVPEQMGEFVDAVDGLARAANAFGVPFVSGNVSLYNQSSNGRSVPPSAIVACVGALEDIAFCVTPRLRAAGSKLYYVGHLQRTLGGSVFADVTGIGRGEPLPAIDYDRAPREVAAVSAAIAARQVLAVHDVSDGGLAVTLAEMAFATFEDVPIGVRTYDVAGWDPAVHWSVAFFGEAGGFVCEVADEAPFLAGLRAFDVPAYLIGETIVEPVFAPFAHSGAGHPLDLRALRERWSAPLRGFYEDLAR